MTPRVQNPRKAGCKRGGPSPWRRAYKPEAVALRISEGHQARPAYKEELEETYHTCSHGVEEALEGNTTWTGRQTHIRLEEWNRIHALMKGIGGT